LGGVAERAIDGNTAGTARDGSISITESEAWASWQVDLGQARLIDRIEIFNRDKDGATVEAQLQNYEIKIMDASQNLVAFNNFHQSGTHADAVAYWETGGKTGQIVKITQLGGTHRYLNLAEVKVLGRSSSSDAYLSRQLLSGSDLQSYAGSNFDADGDELLDSWETTHGFNTATLETGDYSPAADPDGDGIFNALESQNGTNPFSADAVSGGMTLEYWLGTSGVDVSEFVGTQKFFEGADVRSVVTPLDALRLDNQGLEATYRIRAAITAPTTGTYRFWLSAMDGAELWLSDDATKFKKRFLAGMGPKYGTGYGYTSTQGDVWDGFMTQMSQEVELTGGQSYFIEILSQRRTNWNADLAIAWAPPGQERSLIPTTALTSFKGESLDADDDYLPDAWETTHGLDPTDNGKCAPATEGEFGDFDEDGLSNHQEYLLGTDPSSADTDGDGLPDFLETNTYGTDPLVSDAESESLVSTLDLSTYTSASHDWILTSEGLVPTSFRGDITYNFSVPSAGYWLVKVTSKLLGSSLTGNSVPVDVSVDGNVLETRDVVYGTQKQAVMTVVTPHLLTGSHTLSLDIDNLIGQRSVVIEKIEILDPGGLDADTNGVADWIDSILTDANGLILASQDFRISPTFLEGVTRSGVTVNSATPSQGVDQNHWFTSLALDAQNSTSVSIAYDDGLTDSTSIDWAVTNTLNNETIIVQEGDSLLLGAVPSGGTTGEAVSIAVPGQTNHALDPGAVATQSSTPFHLAPASNAIDGETYGPADDESTRTGNETDAWWQVDLGVERSINRIVIWNKAPNKYALANFKIVVLDDNDTVSISKDFYTQNIWNQWVKDDEIWDLGGFYDARKVRVERIAPAWGENKFEIAEVQVFGTTSIELATDSDSSPYQFDQAGTHVLTATHPTAGTGTLTVEVKKAESDTASFDLLAGYRDWVSFDIDTTDTDLSFDGRDLIHVDHTPQMGYDSNTGLLTRFRLPTFAGRRGSYNLLLRTEAEGAVIETQPVNVIGFTSGLQGGVSSAVSSPIYPGMLQISRLLVVTDLPAGAYVEVESIRSGLTFLDGSGLLTLTAADFVDGVYSIEMLIPENFTGGFCHRVTIYDSNGNLISQY